MTYSSQLQAFRILEVEMKVADEETHKHIYADSLVKVRYMPKEPHAQGKSWQLPTRGELEEKIGLFKDGKDDFYQSVGRFCGI